MRFSLVSAIAVVSLLGAGLAQAEVLKFHAMLSGASEVPPTDSAGTGMVSATLDTDSKTFSYNVTYTGLTGPVVAAHFHGPATAGVNAGPVVPVRGALTSPITGSATLTDPQIADLKSGLWYFNLHTAAHGGGEVRGQLKPAM